MLDGWVCDSGVVIWAKDEALGSRVGAWRGGQRAGWVTPPLVPWSDSVAQGPAQAQVAAPELAFHQQRTEIRSVQEVAQGKPPGGREPCRTTLKGGAEGARERIVRDVRLPGAGNVRNGKGEKIVKTD